MGISTAFDATLHPEMVGHKLPALGQIESDPINLLSSQRATKDGEAINTVSEVEELCTQERQGWKGYVEWERYPEKKAKAHKILTSQTFPGVPDSKLGFIPDGDPVLSSGDFKALYAALGGELATIADDSWHTVLREKHPDMLHNRRFPYNGEPPRNLASSDEISSNPLHPVRNHGGIPLIDKERWELSLEGLVQQPKSYTLDELMDESRFPRLQKTVTLKCSESHLLEQASGGKDPQGPPAERTIGTARYVGTSLKQVIEDCGGLVEPAQNFELYGADTCIKDLDVGNYVVSVPWPKIKADEVLLAWEMNGEPLPKTHGYPLRVVVIGGSGAQSVKWLYRIRAVEISCSKTESGPH